MHWPQPFWWQLERHRPAFDRLCADLDAAREASSLPEEGTAKPALDDLLFRIRMKGALGGR